MEEAVATFDVYSGADFGTISRRSVITCHVYSKELVGPIDVNKQIQIKKTNLYFLLPQRYFAHNFHPRCLVWFRVPFVFGLERGLIRRTDRELD